MNEQMLVEYLNDENTFRCGWGPKHVDTIFETMPSEFIGFAEIDLQSNFEHRYINALSNAKRALDCQADRLLKLFGYYQESQDKHWGFPTKLTYIQKFEIIAPRILKKINKTRNLMEHQYIKPKPEQVEDFLDVCSLFIASTDHYVSAFSDDIDYLNDDNEIFCQYSELQIIIDSVNSNLLVKTVRIRGDSEKPEIKFEVNKSHPLYIDIFKQHLKKMEFR